MGLLNSNSLNEWLTGIPERAREAYRGLLNTPSEVKQLFDPQFQQGLLKNATPVSREDIINQGLNISGMAPYGLAGHIAYHGSPHKFDKFDMSKIGTGEGAQAYGHGLYFAESPEVGKEYATKLSNVDSSGYANAQLNAQNLLQRFNGDRDWAKEVVKDQLGAIDKADPNFSRLTATLDVLDGKAPQQLGSTGNLYKVDIPDEAIPRMLDWDKPLSEQPEGVRVAVQDLGLTANATGKDAYNALANLARDGAIARGNNAATTLGGSQSAASVDLQGYGIPGIRYLDQGSRTAGEGTYNYVLFDDQLPRILEINGQPTGLLSWADEAKKVKKKK